MTSKSDGASTRRPPIGLLRGASLFLDFDGTLVDIAPRPDEVEVTVELRDLLERLRQRLDGRLAILTGRAADDVEQLLHPVSLPIGAQHGLETRTGARRTSAERPAILDELLLELRQLERDYPGILIEEKPLGIALHYRGAPQAEQACSAAIRRAAERSGLDVQPGKMVLELKPHGANKGDALRRIMTDPPFAGSRPIFLGDDLTDEPAFAAAQELGGAGILIGDRAETAARFCLPSVHDAVEWLDRACEAAR